jgi:acetyl-CoA C-acetyltransferase
MRKVAIIGIGRTAYCSISPHLSFKESMFEAAVKAYNDAGINPRQDVDSFIACAEDFVEGRSISDIHVPDQIGAVMRPVQTIPSDGIYGLAVGYMLINTGIADIVVVEAHSKISNLLTPDYCNAFALDPVLNRPLGHNANFIAGMEMNRYLYESGATKEQCAMVSVKNKRNALANPVAANGASITVDDVMSSEMMFYPLSKLDISPPADGTIVIVMASEEKTKSLSKKPIWIKGVGWCSDAPSLETREWGEPIYIKLAAEQAYKQAGIKYPSSEIDLAEIDDTFSYKELQHMEALRLCQRGEAGSMIEKGATEHDGKLPVNLSGGSLGVGDLCEATGLEKVAELVLQLRGEAGKQQVPNAKVGLAQSWRGIPSTSGAVIILSNEEGK